VSAVYFKVYELYWFITLSPKYTMDFLCAIAIPPPARVDAALGALYFTPLHYLNENKSFAHLSSVVKSLTNSFLTKSCLTLG